MYRELKNPRAELISSTEMPIQTVYCIWQQSKEDRWWMSPASVHNKMLKDEEFKAEVYSVFKKIMRQQIPTNENISFTFMLHDLPISLREQLVRHRIGSKVGDNYGVDIVPELQSSSYWSQSMRILSFDKLFRHEKYFTPESIRNNKSAEYAYHGFMESCETYYKLLLQAGIPMEDARNVLPLGSTMGITWTLNLASLLHIIGKRSCWILQYGLWSYLIKSIIDELVNKVDPIFREAVLPPCFNEGEFSSCVFKHENERRLSDEDQLPLCPLYTHHELMMKGDGRGAEQVEYDAWKGRNPELYDQQLKLSQKYSELWDRNPWTGEPKEDIIINNK